MAYVYILQSDKNGHFYIGSTKDINKRLAKHESGQVVSTKKLLPLRLVMQQEFHELNTARKIERRLKRFKRRDFIAKIVKDGRIKILGP